MDFTELSLILIGIIAVVFSFFFIHNEKEETDGYAGENYEQLLAKEKLLELKLEQMCEQLQEQLYEKADQQLCKLSNEKIMAVNEYGAEVIEKIEQNHSEVVFLYSMLNEKSKEIKTCIREEVPLEASSVRTNTEKVKKEKAKSVASQGRKKVSKKKTEENPTAKETSHGVVITGEERAEYDKKKEKIMSLYQQGKGILDISKELELGQGEVQLIVNLYKEANV